MPETAAPAVSAPSSERRPASAGAVLGGRSLSSRLFRLTATHAVGAVVVFASAAVYLALYEPDLAPLSWAVVAGALLLGLLLLWLAVVGVLRAVRHQVSALRQETLGQQREVSQAAEWVRQGEAVPAPRPLEPPPFDNDDWHRLAHDLDRLRFSALAALAEAPPPAAPPPPAPDHRVGVFVNLARRLQSLVHREIQLLDELESQVEDPDLLKGLFSVDHLATRIRRHAENLAVLGGAVTRRQWSKPVNLYEVLRSAVAEVERYSRVKLVRPIEGTVQGHAVADVIHLIAELVENATMFSNPQTQVLLRAQPVTAGLAVEVEDRGLGMPVEEQHRVNLMLAHPDQIDIDELLRDGRIGLFVVSTLARRHGVAVQLQTNIYGGIQAVIVLPPGLLGQPPATAVQLPAAEPVAAPAAYSTAHRSGYPAGAGHPPAAGWEPIPAVAEPVPALPSAVPAMVAASRVYQSEAQTVTAAYPTPSVPPTMPQAVPQPVPEPAPRPVAQSVVPAPRQSMEGLTVDQWLATPGPAAVPHPAPTTGQYRSADPPEPPRSTPSAPSAGYGASAAPGRQPDDPRPPLPHRRVQAHLTPQLRDAPAVAEDPTDGPDPGLMSAFRRGFNRADHQPGESGA